MPFLRWLNHAHIQVNHAEIIIIAPNYCTKSEGTITNSPLYVMGNVWCDQAKSVGTQIYWFSDRDKQSRIFCFLLFFRVRNLARIHSCKDYRQQNCKNLNGFLQFLQFIIKLYDENPWILAKFHWENPFILASFNYLYLSNQFTNFSKIFCKM